MRVAFFALSVQMSCILAALLHGEHRPGFDGSSRGALGGVVGEVGGGEFWWSLGFGWGRRGRGLMCFLRAFFSGLVFWRGQVRTWSTSDLVLTGTAVQLSVSVCAFFFGLLLIWVRVERDDLGSSEWSTSGLCVSFGFQAFMEASPGEYGSHESFKRAASSLEASNPLNDWERGVQILKKRDQAVAGKGKVDGIGEEHLLALILKEKAVDDGECKRKLEQYCKSLHNANLKSEDIHDKLKGYCKGGNAETEKCKTLAQNVKEKCEKLKTALEEALKTALDGKNQPFNETVCEKHEHECLFLEGADPTNLKDKCSKLRTKCYERKRQKVRDEVLMRALKGALKEKGDEDCKTALKAHCVTLGPMSSDLMQACLMDKTCEQLIIQAQGKCDPLKKEVNKALNNVDKKTCLPLLEKCYFYSPNCKEKEVQEKCDELKKKCEKHDVEYMPPEGPFIPIDPTVTVLDRVGLDMLYKEAAKEGVLIERLSDLTMENLIFFLGQKADGDFDDKTCQEAVKKDCEYLKTLTGEKNDNYKCEDKCGQLNGKVNEKHDSLSI
ncbi:hypothetical protein PCK1_001635 [Pneumocystis canis]|nr:hypothetical protein PCK1_001635 [Pneumocystis canis]